MKAAIFKEPGLIEIEEQERKRPEKDQVLIEVKATGICGTDHHIYHGEFAAAAPVIPGHEIAGKVVETGNEVDKIKKEDRVVVNPNINCGKCFYCRRGEIHHCNNLRNVGVSQDGGFAEYVLIPETNVYKLSDNISYEEGSMIEPISCCLHGIDRANIETGDLVVVLGGGAIGLIIAQLAQRAGARRVIISELSEQKRNLAEKFGFESVVAPSDLDDYLKKTSPEGADVVIEAVGIKDTVEQTFEVVRKGGTILIFGVAPEDLEVPLSPFEMFDRELTIKGTIINPFVTSRSLDLLEEGIVRVDDLITDKYQLEELPEILESGSGPDSVKSLIVFD